MKVLLGQAYIGAGYKELYYEPERTGSYEFICNSNEKICMHIYGEVFEENIESRKGVNDYIIKWARTLQCKKRYKISVWSDVTDTFEFKVEINHIEEPKSTHFKYQWGLLNKRNGLDINILPVWKYIRESSVKVGIADTGIDYNNYNLSYLNNKKRDIMEYAHGTHVAGVIASRPNEGIGCIGIVEDRNIISLKILGEAKKELKVRKASEAFIIAIEYAMKNGIRIINCSFCGKDFSEKEKNAMEKAKNIIFVLAAGNHSLNLECEKMFPVCYHLNNVISVAAIDKEGKLYETSNYGRCIDIAAPGEKIVGPYAKNQYIKANGTSAAAPFVTGVCALLLEKYPNLTPYELKRAITSKDNITLLESLTGKVKVGGIINTYKIFNSLAKY